MTLVRVWLRLNFQQHPWPEAYSFVNQTLRKVEGRSAGAEMYNLDVNYLSANAHLEDFYHFGCTLVFENLVPETTRGRLGLVPPKYNQPRE